MTEVTPPVPSVIVEPERGVVWCAPAKLLDPATTGAVPESEITMFVVIAVGLIRYQTSVRLFPPE
jgi:hypothetical protein